MNKFRICENEYNWFKIQIYHPPHKILFIPVKGSWNDINWDDDDITALFRTKAEAKNELGKIIKKLEKNNQNFTCKGEY